MPPPPPPPSSASSAILSSAGSDAGSSTGSDVLFIAKPMSLQDFLFITAEMMETSKARYLHDQANLARLSDNIKYAIDAQVGHAVA